MSSTERISRDRMFMNMALEAAKRSTCNRLGVGCLITNWDGTQVVSIGYNGNARGLDNNCDSTEPGKCGCIHAEVNALIKAPYNLGDTLILYTTTSPCLACAKLIINSRVVAVFYSTNYRLDDGLTLLRDSGIWCGTVEEREKQSRLFDDLTPIHEL